MILRSKGKGGWVSHVLFKKPKNSKVLSRETVDVSGGVFAGEFVFGLLS